MSLALIATAPSRARTPPHLMRWRESPLSPLECPRWTSQIAVVVCHSPLCPPLPGSTGAWRFMGPTLRTRATLDPDLSCDWSRASPLHLTLQPASLTGDLCRCVGLETSRLTQDRRPSLDIFLGSRALASLHPRGNFVSRAEPPLDHPVVRGMVDCALLSRRLPSLPSPCLKQPSLTAVPVVAAATT